VSPAVEFTVCALFAHLRFCPMSMTTPHKPTKAELLAARGKTVPDVIAPGLQVLFCGINPSLYSVAVGHHFARPGNRFWPALHAAGFTDRLLSPFEECELLKHGYGITNIVDRATASADELSVDELVQGAQHLEIKLRRYRPRFLAVLGIEAYGRAFKHPKTIPGRQADMMDSSAVWVLPNPSGLNAHYQLEDLAQVFRELCVAAESSG
jgi:TDG/mug DNA glycosylase family protein